jgi:hypothetical protein
MSSPYRLSRALGAMLFGFTLAGCALTPVRSTGIAPTPISVAVRADVKDPTAAPAAATAAPGAPTATPASAPQPELPAAAPTTEEARAIGHAALIYLGMDGVEQPAVVGAAATAGDYAVALAGVFLEETGARYIFLQRRADGWLVLYDSPRPEPAALAARGIPASLGADFPIYGLHQAVINDMNDPRGPAGDVLIIVGALEQGYARVHVAPEDPTRGETTTIFYGPRPEGGYQRLVEGTSFSPEELDALGIPPSVR